MRARWKALDELESMCWSVVLETVVFAPQSAGQTRALLWRKDTVQKKWHNAFLLEELHSTCVAELSVIVEWGGGMDVVVLLQQQAIATHHLSCVMTENATKRY